PLGRPARTKTLTYWRILLGEGIPIGVAYGIWAAAGVALVALLGAMIFGETLSITTILGILMIMVGVYVVQTGDTNPSDAEVLAS
ncbi:MAG: SMR family transporter, partial [Yaniella sp.]|nr:SMR family transporter [Yaniella sp.]MDN5913299.1 SMR family transporter [Yaniella sp.]MDN6678643.1 SMR family transporter [Yaniella sp.]